MKIFVFAVCVGLVPLCLSNEGASKESIREYLTDASDQFVDDLHVLFKTFSNDRSVSEMGGSIVEIFWKEVKRDENSKITVQGVKDHLSRLKEDLARNSDKQEKLNDVLNTFETTLSTKLTPERCSRLVNLIRVFGNPDSTSEEIEKPLNYYYGTQPTKTQP